MRIEKKFVSLILTLIILFGVMSINVNAAVLYPVGDWVYEKINNGTEFEIDSYKGDSSEVGTPYYHNSTPITSVGTGAFMSNNFLTKVYLSDTITVVQDHAFLNCENLQTIVIEGDIKNIIHSAFSGCKSLENINLEDTSISYVSSSCFMDCDALKDIEIPETVTSINENAFASCDSLAKITIPASVTEIHKNAFYNTPNVVIYCYTDSAAHIYAEENAIEYVLIDQIPAVTYILGDVDNDGKVTISDATDIQLLIAEIIEPYDENTVLRGDITKDNVLSIMDATYIQRYIAEFDDGLHIGETFEV